MERVSLTQVARALRVPQHKLIHFCEKRVVVPDLLDARGRGSSRGFSYRNLFEFAVALEMRRMELPVSLIRAVLRVLRSFELAASRMLPGFSFPESLRSADAPTVRVLIVDGSRLSFSIGKGPSEPAIFGDVELPNESRRTPRARVGEVRRLSSAVARKLLASARTRSEINLTLIASSLPLPTG